MTNKVRIDKWYWWEWIDAKFNEDWQYYYADWIDISSSSSSFTLAHWFKQWTTTWWEEISHIQSVSSWASNKTFYFTETAKIYEWWNDDDTPTYDLSTIDLIYADPILDSVKDATYLYLLQKYWETFRVLKISKDDAYTWNWWNTIVFITWPTPTVPYNGKWWFEIAYWWNFFIWWWNVFSSYVISSWAIDFTDSSYDVEIVWITFTSDLFKIWTKKWLVSYFNKSYSLIDVANITLNARKVRTIRGVDYVLWWYTSFSVWLYYLEGKIIKELYVPNNTDSYKFRIKDVDIKFDDRFIYLIAETYDWYYSIASIWQNRKWFPTSFSLLWSNIAITDYWDINASLKNSIIHSIHSYKWILYYSFRDAASSKIYTSKYTINYWYVVNSNKIREWTLITNKLQFRETNKMKEIVEIVILAKNISSTDELTIIKDDNLTTTLKVNMYDYKQDVKGGFDVIRINNITNSFNELQLKFKLKTVLETQTSASIYSVDVFYTPIQ